MKKNNKHVKMMDVPIYNAILYIVVTSSSDLAKVRNEEYFVNIFGPVDDDFKGLFSSNKKGTFGVFLSDDLKMGDIAHEVFHLTHKILEYHNVTFEHEAAALLHGYLFENVYQFFEKKRV